MTNSTTVGVRLMFENEKQAEKILGLDLQGCHFYKNRRGSGGRIYFRFDLESVPHFFKSMQPKFQQGCDEPDDDISAAS